MAVLIAPGNARMMIYGHFSGRMVTLIVSEPLCAFCFGGIRGMKTIHKFFLNINDESPVEMPKGAKILTVQMQKGYPCLWAVVETGNAKELRIFCVRSTGHALKGNEGQYIGTFQAMGGDLVFHVFEAKEA